jgi:hypothetical protein
MSLKFRTKKALSEWGVIIIGAVAIVFLFEMLMFMAFISGPSNPAQFTGTLQHVEVKDTTITLTLHNGTVTFSLPRNQILQTPLTIGHSYQIDLNYYNQLGENQYSLRSITELP